MQGIHGGNSIGETVRAVSGDGGGAVGAGREKSRAGILCRKIGRDRKAHALVTGEIKQLILYNGPTDGRAPLLEPDGRPNGIAVLVERERVSGVKSLVAAV